MAQEQQSLVDTKQIQDYLREHSLDGWLIYDYNNRNPLTTHVLGDGASFISRRWVYFVPAVGEPQYLFHAIEANTQFRFPGQVTVYRSWQDFRRQVSLLLRNKNRIAIEYSPGGSLPAVSVVDGGTMEFFRSCGVELFSSADLIQHFTCRLTDGQVESHLTAAGSLYRIKDIVYKGIREDLARGFIPSEYQIQQRIVSQYEEHGLVSEFPPIVAVGRNAGNPHYQPEAHGCAELQPGQVLMLDMWAKKKATESIYADITWMAWLGGTVPDSVHHVFNTVIAARDAVVDLVQSKGKAGQVVRGFEADDAARSLITEAGYGDAFTHRTGHNLGADVHGSGANLDNLETHEERILIPRTAFTIEPGIYLDVFGVRSEIDVYHDPDKGYRVTTPPQQEIVLLDTV